MKRSRRIGGLHSGMPSGPARFLRRRQTLHMPGTGRFSMKRSRRIGGLQGGICMVQEIFKRYDKKYLLTESDCSRLMLTIGGILKPDEYGKHRISNIYFDTPDCLLIRRSLEKPVYKEKLRLRAYGDEICIDSPVFPELKKKYDSVVYKRRIQMNLKEARACFYDGAAVKRQDQIFRELDFTMKRYALKPMAYIAYEREAYICCLDEEIRLTFDRNIVGRSQELELSLGNYGDRILEEGMVLMELKVAEAVPLWLGRILSEMHIFPVSFSKYGTYYQKYLASGSREESHAGQMQKGGRRCA